MAVTYITPRNIPLRAGARPVIEIELIKREWCVKEPFKLDITEQKQQKESQQKKDDKKKSKEEQTTQTTTEETATEEASEEQTKPTIAQYLLNNISSVALMKYLNKCKIKEQWKLTAIQSVDFNKSITESTGTGSLVVPYTKQRFQRLMQGDELNVRIGYEYDSPVPDPETGKETTRILRDAFSAFIAEVKKGKRDITVQFADTGVLLEQKATTESYVDKTVKGVLEDVIKKAGLKPNIKLRKEILEAKVSFKEETTAGGTTGGGYASGPCQNSCGRSDCPLPKSGSGKYTVCTVTGPCECGSTDIQYNRCPPDCNVDKCAGHPGSGSTAQGGSNIFPEGTFFCCSCDRDYCGCGTIHDGSHRRVLKTTCGETVTGEPGSESSGGETTTSTQEMTYWDIILKALEEFEEDTHVFVKGDTCYVHEIKEPFEDDSKILFALSDWNMLEESFEMTEGKAPIVAALKITCKGGEVVEVLDKDWEKYGEMGRLELNWPDLSPCEARKKGKKILRTLQRVDSSEAVTCEVLGDPEFFPGRWVHINNQTDEYKDELYLKGISHKLGPDGFDTSLELALWKPETKSSGGGEGQAGGGDQGTLASILTEASKYRHAFGCSDAQCLVKNGWGDCWAMSEYLFQKLCQAGFKARIIQYTTAESPRHRTVQYMQNGQWVDVPYREYGFDRGFRTTASRPGLTVIKTC